MKPGACARRWGERTKRRVPARTAWLLSPVPAPVGVRAGHPAQRFLLLHSPRCVCYGSCTWGSPVLPRPASVRGVSGSERRLDREAWEVMQVEAGLLPVWTSWRVGLSREKGAPWPAALASPGRYMVGVPQAGSLRSLRSVLELRASLKTVLPGPL